MLQAWRKQKVMTWAGMITGFPTDTPKSIARDIEIIKKELPLDILEFFFLTPLPGLGGPPGPLPQRIGLRQTGNPRALQIHLGNASPFMTMRYFSTLTAEEALRIQQEVEFD